MRSNLRVFAGSVVLHSVIAFGVLRAVTRVDPGHRWLVVAVGLVLVAALGVAKGAWYGRVANVAYIGGATVVGIGATVFVLWLSWALTHPVGEPPPMRTHIIELMQGASALWIVAPTLAIALTALGAAEIGRLRHKPVSVTG